MSFQAGFDKGCTFTPDDGGKGTTLRVTAWNVEDGADAPEVTHTGTNGQQAFVAGITRAAFSISANYDSAETPFTIGIRGGKKGTFTFSTGGPELSMHVIIEKVPYQNAVAGVVSFTAQGKSDALKGDAVVNSVAFL